MGEEKGGETRREQSTGALRASAEGMKNGAK